jgi:hypothetical protein
MARPSHQPDPLLRRQVEALAGYGVPEADISGMLAIDPKTLRKHYRDELDHGHVKANAKVAENLFRKATGDGRESVTAAIFWLKARARWRETSIHEVSGHDGRPIETVTHSNTDLAKAILLVLNRTSPQDDDLHSLSDSRSIEASRAR